jgi:nicotinate-nucleotide adenylyltransferase
MRVGVFGGTFDPVHLGHLILSEQCREQARLDRVLLIPAPRPPHKLERASTPFAQRVEMLQLAIAGYPVFQVSEMEKDRPGPSYTVDTLRQLRDQQPDDELFLLIGSDCLPDLPRWHEPLQIAELATLLVVSRPGWPVPLQLPERFRIQVIDTPLIDIASSHLRERVRLGRSIRYLVPRAVECYIQAHRLYQEA